MKAVLSPAMEVEYDFKIDLTGSTLRIGDQVPSGQFGVYFIGAGVIVAETGEGRARTGYVQVNEPIR